MSQATPLPTAIPGGRLVCAGLSDQGLVRRRNEDAFGIFPAAVGKTRHLLVVADGVGGSAAGDVASRVAVETLSAAFTARRPAAAPLALLDAAMQAANAAVLSAAVGDPTRTRMASTCTAALLAGRRFHIGHVGDSRAYLRRRGVLSRLTQDHTVAEDYRARGLAVDVGSRYLEQIITRCIGLDDPFTVDLSSSEPLTVGDALLLCSDGLTKCVTDEEIGEFLRVAQPAAACELLVDLVRRRGAPDNVTVVIGAIVPTAP